MDKNNKPDLGDVIAHEVLERLDLQDRKLDSMGDVLARIDDTTSRMEKKLDDALKLLREQRRMLRDLSREVSSRHEKLVAKLKKGFLGTNKRLDVIQEDMKNFKSSLRNVINSLEESDIQIKATASDFESVLEDLNVEQSDSGFVKHDFDTVMPSEEFIVSNIFRLTEKEGEGIENTKIKAACRKMNQGDGLNVDNALSMLKRMKKEDRESLKQYRDTSLAEMVKRTTFVLKNDVHEAIFAKENHGTLTKEELKAIYNNAVESVANNGWRDKEMSNSRAEKIVQNAFINLYENKAHFLKNNKQEFEERISDISSAINQDRERELEKIDRGMKGSLLELGRQFVKGDQEGLEYDPNSMESLFTAKNIAFGLRSYTTFVVYNKASEMFGEELADEMKDMASQMKTRQGMLNKLTEYVINEGEKGSKCAPPPQLLEEIKGFGSKIKSHWNSNSWEAKVINRYAFDIALAKVESDSFRHVKGASVRANKEPSNMDKAVAEQIIAATCVMGHENAEKYIKGELDPKREDIKRSCIHEMEKNKDLVKVFNQMSPEIKRAMGREGPSHTLN